MTVATIHLVRHGAHSLLDHILVGRRDVPLSQAGVAQAAALARFYTGQAVRAVVSSPVQRAQETAAPIAAALGLAVDTDPDLAEVEFGAWSGQSFSDLAQDPAWHAWNRARGLAATPGEETMLGVQARAMAAMRRMANPGGLVIAVSHSDVIKAILMQVLGMPLDLMHRLHIDPASRSIVVLGADFARVDGVNLPPG